MKANVSTQRMLYGSRLVHVATALIISKKKKRAYKLTGKIVGTITHSPDCKMNEEKQPLTPYLETTDA